MVASTLNNSITAIGEPAIGEFKLGDIFISPIWPPLTEPVRQKINPRLALALGTSGQFATLIPEQGKNTGSWYLSLAEPVRLKPDIRAANQSVLAYIGAETQNAPNNNFAEQSYYSKYAYPWAEPVRVKSRLPEGLQQFYTGDTTPIPTGRNLGWFAQFSNPVRVPLRLLDAIQQFYANDTTPIPTGRNLSWYRFLDNPVRIKPGLRTELQQWAHEPTMLTILKWGYYLWLTEPQRFKPGLKSIYQQFLAYHPRILPTPTVTATMAATETNADVALFGVYVYDSTASGGAVSANVSVTEGPTVLNITTTTVRTGPLGAIGEFPLGEGRSVTTTTTTSGAVTGGAVSIEEE